MLQLNTKKDKLIYLRILKDNDLYSTFIEKYNVFRRLYTQIQKDYFGDKRCQDIFIFLGAYDLKTINLWAFNLKIDKNIRLAFKNYKDKIINRH